MRLTGTETLPIVNVNLAEKLTSSHGRMRNSPSTMRPEFLGKALRSEPSSRRAHTDALGRKICTPRARVCVLGAVSAEKNYPRRRRRREVESH